MNVQADQLRRAYEAPLQGQSSQAQVPRGAAPAQAVLGLCVYLGFALPYCRRVHGLERLQPRQRYVFAANHVSLLDTILLGGIFWRRRFLPMLVLGDRAVWRGSWIKRFLSCRLGYLLDRGKLNPGRIRELQTFGRAGADFNLVVFPEGTRGDGEHVAPCQPGLYYVAQQARLPLVPVFFENMQLVSTKTGPCHVLKGLRKVEVHFGQPIAAETYLALARDEFAEFVRGRITAANGNQ